MASKSATTSEPIITTITLPQLIDEVLDMSEPEADFLKLNGEPEWNGKRMTSGNKRRKPKGESKRQRNRRAADLEAIDDYLENITATMRAEAAETGEMPSDGFGLLRDLGGDDIWLDDSSTDDDDAASDSDAVRKYKAGWDDDSIRDFDEISTDEEGPRGLISKVLNKRTRPSGLQYLIKWDGYETDDATWTLSKKLDSLSDAKVKGFEEAYAEKEAQMEESSGSESSDEYDEDEDEDDDDDDEDSKLAKLLQRHEEGLMGEDDDFANIIDFDDDFIPMSGKRNRNKRQSRQTVPDITMDPRTGRYPSASEMASAYDAFDVMDWERPSISRKKGKGRMAELNLSDSELEAQIEGSWQRDRMSKKLRKMEREQLRREGLLGVKAQKTGKINMLDKYKEGITMTQIYDEIREFMMREHSRYVCPFDVYKHILTLCL